MKKLVVLSRDSKMMVQIGQWIKDLPEKIILERLTSIEEFEKHYCNPIVVEESSAKNQATDATASADQPADAPKPVETDPKKLEEEFQRKAAATLPITLLVVDYAFKSAETWSWLKTTKQKLQTYSFSKPEQPTSVMIIDFESPEHGPEFYRQPGVDDLLFKPIDQSLFLQKLEIWLSENRQVSPTFLFKQKTNIKIDMGKDAEIEQISEFALAMRNPIALAEGVYANMFSSIFGLGERNHLFGRVYKSVRHPDFRGEYLVYFTFFGIRHEQLLNLRKYIRSKNKHYHPPDGEFVLPDGVNLELMALNIFVLDMNIESRGMVEETLKSNFHNAKVQAYPSYGAFLRRLMNHIPKPASSSPAKPEATPAKAPSAKPGDPPAEPVFIPPWSTKKDISFLIEGSEHGMVSMEPVLPAEDLLFNTPVQKFLEAKTDWLRMIHADDREEFDEFLHFVKSGQKGHCSVTIEGPDKATYRMELAGSLERSGEAANQLIKLTWTEAAPLPEGASLSRSNTLGVTCIDCILIDGSFIKTDVGPWLEGLNELIKKANLMPSRGRLPIIILGQEDSSTLPANYRNKGITDFIFKPVDRKTLSQKVSVHLPNMIIRNKGIDFEFAKNVAGPLKLAKEVQMEELSEFGLQIKSMVPIQENVFVRFFSELFVDERGEGILARCTSVETDKENKALYHVFFTFFGISDAFLKHIRKWIREDYVHKKDASNS